MPTMPQDYYNSFDPAKNYERALYRDGFVLQGAELNEVQSASQYRLKSVADAIFKDGDIIREAQIAVDAVTGEVRAQAGALYLNGAVRNVAAAILHISVTGTVSVGVRLVECVISEEEDPSLYNPAIGSRGEGEAGAWRLKMEACWSVDADPNAKGEFYPVYTIENGVMRPKEAPPTLDAFTQSLAGYDRDSTAGGSYIVSGLTVLQAEDAVNDGGIHQVFTVAEGRARVNGYGVTLATSRRVTTPAAPDLRLIDTEVHTADEASATAGGQRLTVAHPPLYRLESLRITTRKTANLVHGAYSGCADALPDTAVTQIVAVRQGETVFTAGIDYKKNGDTVDWSPFGNEVASGSTYSVTYDCITAVEGQHVDADGVAVVGAVAGTSILVTYRQALPRWDRLCLTQEGQCLFVRGVASERNAQVPEAPPGVLPLASICQTWRESTRAVDNDGVHVVPFSQWEALTRRIDYALQEVARQRLEADITTREAGARVGLFVDPLLNDDMRDQGIPQTAAIMDGMLTLPIVAARAAQPSGDVAVPTARAYTVRTLLEQPYRTLSVPVNPYMAREPLPARVRLTPAVDHWTDTQTVWTSSLTRTLTVGSGGATRTSQNTVTEVLGTSKTALEHLRQIDVRFELEGFGEGEHLESIIFDGLAVTPLA